MKQYLGVDPSDVQQDIDDTIVCYIGFGFLEKLYKYHLDAKIEADGDDAHVIHRIVCALRLYLMFLVSTSIFMDKSVYYVDVVYLSYFIELERVHKYN